MFITDERVTDEVSFKTLLEGEVFEYEDDVYMKIEEVSYNDAVCLESGLVRIIDGDEYVKPLKYEFKLK